jgi:hypothetical protein
LLFTLFFLIPYPSSIAHQSSDLHNSFSIFQISENPPFLLAHVSILCSCFLLIPNIENPQPPRSLSQNRFPARAIPSHRIVPSARHHSWTPHLGVQSSSHPSPLPSCKAPLWLRQPHRVSVSADNCGTSTSHPHPHRHLTTYLPKVPNRQDGYACYIDRPLRRLSLYAALGLTLSVTEHIRDETLGFVPSM